MKFMSNTEGTTIKRGQVYFGSIVTEISDKGERVTPRLRNEHKVLIFNDEGKWQIFNLMHFTPVED